MGLILLLNCNKWIFSIVFPILLLSSALIGYFELSIGLKFTPAIVDIFFSNVSNTGIVKSVISPGLIFCAFLSVLISFIIVFIRWRFVEGSFNQTVVVGICGSIIVSCPLFFIDRIRPAVASRLPYALYYSTRQYLETRSDIRQERSTYNNVAAVPSETPPDVIFIIGESLRADHVSFNGYFRNTMPTLNNDTTIISFPNFYTDFTHTEISVPHILARWSAEHPDAVYEDQSFVTLFKKARYSTAWFANQDLSNSYSYFAHECDTIVHCNAGSSLYSYGVWLDMDIVEHFNTWMEQSDDNPKLAIIHTIGSHWWYKSHYTEKHALFKPEITHKDIGGLSRQDIINSYDNTIIATDEFLSELIRTLRPRNAVLIFVSDHGESLGEDGVYLHSQDTEPLHLPACFIWYSESYDNLFNKKIARLKSNRERFYNSSAIFHTVLGLADISTDARIDSLSLIN